MSDPWDLPSGRTHSIPPCEEHPPLSTWTVKQLILGSCPKCSQGSINGTWRELQARRLIAEAEPHLPQRTSQRDKEKP